MRSAAFPLLVVTLCLAACGSSPTERPAPWAAEHPDPPGMHFADAQGLCSVTVRYPNQAPGEIDYGGDVFIQRDRSDAHTGSGKQLGRSGDWTIYQPAPGRLQLVTATASFDYRNGANCGSNAAPPT
jgi:hypothetical protein